MTREEVIRDITAKAAELLFCGEEEIEADVSMTEVLGLDSIEMQDLSLAVSKKYNVNRNMFSIINDAAVVLDRYADADPDDLIRELENIARMRLNSEDREDFRQKLAKESRGRLLSAFQSYITIEMIADSVISEMESGAARK